MASSSPESIPSILIIDDHELTARSLAAVLKGAGYGTEVAHNGADAIAMATKCPPTCAVIDIHLPDLNGLVLSSKLREQLGPDVPLLVCSGDTSNETLNTLAHVGATYFLSKPVNPAILLQIIGRWVPPPGQH